MVLILPDRIATERLRLITITPAEAADMLAGRRHDRWHPSYPRPDDVAAATLVRPAVEPDRGWGPRHVVFDRLAVGTLGCFAPPEQGEAEVGFGLVPEARGRGLATEGLGALIRAVDLAGIGLRARVSPDNPAALRVLAVCGFTELRGTTDEGELVLARPPAVAP